MVLTKTSITIGWKAGSSLTSTYEVYGYRASSRRDLSVGTPQLLQNSTATSITVSSLASGSFYTFTIYGKTASGSNQNVATATFQTLASSDSTTLPDGGKSATHLKRPDTTHLKQPDTILQSCPVLLNDPFPTPTHHSLLRPSASLLRPSRVPLASLAHPSHIPPTLTPTFAAALCIFSPR